MSDIIQSINHNLDVSGRSAFNLALFFIERNDTITEISVISKDNVTVGRGDAIFQINKNGTPLFAVSPSDLRPKITVGNRIVTVTGLSIAVTKGDIITLDKVNGAFLTAPVGMMVTLAGSVSSGGISNVIFSDDFEDGVIDSEWTDGLTGIATETGGHMVLTRNSNGYLRTQTKFLTGGGMKSFEAQLVGTPPVGGGDFAGIFIGDGASNIVYMTTRNNKVSLYVNEIGSFNAVIDPFDISLHSYFRIAIIGKSVLCQVSADGIDWRTYYTFTSTTFDWGASPNLNGYLGVWSSGSTQVCEYSYAKVRDLSNF